jgi:hypothetical protein
VPDAVGDETTMHYPSIGMEKQGVGKGDRAENDR